MTRDEILDMPAGRDMDALIALKFFGWHWENVQNGLLLPSSDHPAMVNNWAAEWDKKGYPNWLPEYSKSISLAWEVVNKICIPAPEDCWTGPIMQINHEHNTCEVIFSQLDSIDCAMESVEATAETAPLAICRAALLATLEDE